MGAPSAEDDATWIHRFFDTDFWATPGGDYAPEASASAVIAGTGFYVWSAPGMVADVQAWLDQPSDDYGWILIGNESTGATAKRLHVPSEERLWDRGMSACAVCDGALPVFRNKDLAVIGGGDSAVEESTFLTKYAAKVYIVHRRDQLRASKIMQERALKNKKIEMIWDSVMEDVEGDDVVTGVRLRNVKTDEISVQPVGGVFYAIGHTPNTGFLGGQVETDETGYIVVTPGNTHTSVEGVFACGDVVDKVYRQAVTAAGTGCMAALDAERWLTAQGIE